jgi:catechol 2,3-dioxygenase-like lactoylglutathione lyase family enzyme
LPIAPLAVDRFRRFVRDVNRGVLLAEGVERTTRTGADLAGNRSVATSEVSDMKAKIAPWAFVLAVQDLEKSTAGFRDIMGCRVLWEEGSDWRLVERDTLRWMLGHCPNETRAAEIGAHSWFGYLSVDDVDGFYAELTARGADCTPPADRSYRMREIVVTTPDGHRFVFGQDLPAGKGGKS